MDSDDEDYGPDSDPYCAHWISVFDDRHPAAEVMCTTCGHSCHEHPALWGCRCIETGCECAQFENAEWPAEEPVRPKK